MIKIGGTEITDVNLGSTPIQKVYMGSTLVWERSSPVPPYDAEVEWLESTDTQYIDTGIKGSSNVGVILTCYYAKSSSSLAATGFVFGSRVGNNNKQYGLIGSYAKNWRYGNNSSGNWSNPEGRVLIFDNTENHNALKVYDTNNTLVNTLTATASTFNNNLNIYLFAMNNNGSALFYSHKIYAVKIYEGTTLVRDYIPVRDGTVGCLYDKVSGTLFYNAGSGNFTCGADVT